MNKKLVIIIDYAHGVDVKGKRSPCGRHEEWKWSRERGSQIKLMLEALGFEVYLSNPQDTEEGLTNRVKFAENLKISDNQIKLLISLHNNAAGNGSQWMSARGFEVWTKQGYDLADDFADLLFPVMEEWFPNMKMRRNSQKLGEQDKEGNLAVLKGVGVYSLLIEYLFQDNKEDVELLLNEVENKKFEDAIVDWVEVIEEFISK